MRAAARPASVLTVVQNIHPSDHAGVLVAAVFGTVKPIPAGFSRSEPQTVVVAGHYIVPHPERGNRETMDHVLARERKFHGLAHRDMQRIYFSAAIRILHLPHPLLASDENLHRVLRRVLRGKKQLGAPPEHDQHDEKGENRPAQLKERGALDLGGPYIG